LVTADPGPLAVNQIVGEFADDVCFLFVLDLSGANAKLPFHLVVNGSVPVWSFQFLFIVMQLLADNMQNYI